jgi:NADPH-dependent 2,4-dienoyl-CoA reductase/sulfur reductase-like enzyme
MPNVVIIGAGPAGIAAASILVDHGVAATLIDEGRRAGGQAYRKPPDGLELDIDALLGSESRKYRRIHALFETIRNRVDYRPETLAWNIFEEEIYTLAGSRIATQRYDAIILAPGAIDRVLPIKGWTLPGVFTLGGAQVILKDQGCLIGRKIVFCGSSPLLYLASLQYRLMGAEIAGVLDTTPFSRKIAALPKLAASPGILTRGLSYLAKLQRQGVRVHHGVRLREVTGRDGVEGIVFHDASGALQTMACDAIAMGFGLRPETQLAELAGCRLRYDANFRQWLPACDIDGRCQHGVYVAGDGCAIGGADAAEVGGMLAAYALLQDRGVDVAQAERRALRGKLKRLRRFQEGLAIAFAWPFARLGEIADDVTMCRCENITAGELRSAVRADVGPSEINRIKAVTRLGMGRCQGRYCGLAAAELAAAELGRPHAEMGWLRAQAPVKPLPISARPGA